MNPLFYIYAVSCTLMYVMAGQVGHSLPHLTTIAIFATLLVTGWRFSVLSKGKALVDTDMAVMMTSIFATGFIWMYYPLEKSTGIDPLEIPMSQSVAMFFSYTSGIFALVLASLQLFPSVGITKRIHDGGTSPEIIDASSVNEWIVISGSSIAWKIVRGCVVAFGAMYPFFIAQPKVSVILVVMFVTLMALQQLAVYFSMLTMVYVEHQHTKEHTSSKVIPLVIDGKLNKEIPNYEKLCQVLLKKTNLLENFKTRAIFIACLAAVVATIETNNSLSTTGLFVMSAFLLSMLDSLSQWRVVKKLTS